MAKPRKTLPIVEVKAPPAVDDTAMVEILGQVRLPRRSNLLLDALAVEDYDMSAHRLLIGWTAFRCHRIGKIAVLADHMIWDSLTSVLTKESTIPARLFDDRTQAILWLERV